MEEREGQGEEQPAAEEQQQKEQELTGSGRGGVNPKQIFTPTDKDKDGIRVLITRYYPKLSPKYARQFTIDYWYGELAPSENLLWQWEHDEITWSEFTMRYLSEIKSNSDAMSRIRELAELSKNITVTLLCYESESNPYYHRYIVKQLIEMELEKQLQPHRKKL